MKLISQEAVTLQLLCFLKTVFSSCS